MRGGSERRNARRRTCERAPIARYFARCARSEAAARLAAREAVLEAKVRPAADAAAFPVRFVFPTCARSEAAARFAVFEAVFDARILPAADAAFLPVFLPAIAPTSTSSLTCLAKARW